MIPLSGGWRKGILSPGTDFAWERGQINYSPKPPTYSMMVMENVRKRTEIYTEPLFA